MVDFAQARRTMVDTQVRPSDVTDLRLIAAMQEVPRERFVPPARQPIAYLDSDLPVTDGGSAPRALLKPMVFSKLLQAAAVTETDHVLDVASATGYSSAVLARLAGSVVALEEDTTLAKATSAVLAALGVDNVTTAWGPLNAGWDKAAPYDVIIIEGAVEVVPDALFGQLKDGGRLITVVGAGPMGKAMIYRNAGGHVTAQLLFDAAAPLLPGFAKPLAFVF